MRTWTAVIVAATVLVSVVRAPAQTPAPDTLAAARELVVAMKSADQFKAVFPMILQQLKGAIVQDRAEVARDYDALVPLMIEQVNSRTAELVDGIAIIYAQNFTAAELRDVTAFYRTPTGQKLLEKVPVIAQQSMLAGQKFGESVIGDLRPRIIEELRKRGHKI